MKTTVRIAEMEKERFIRNFSMHEDFRPRQGDVVATVDGDVPPYRQQRPAVNSLSLRCCNGSRHCAAAAGSAGCRSLESFFNRSQSLTRGMKDRLDLG
jgi:hypothetical protein